MTESHVTRKLLRRLRETLPAAVIFKHNDFYTAGIPDFTITLNGKTTWFEIKVIPNKVTELQALFIVKLQPRSHIITFSRDGKYLSIDNGETISFALGLERIISLSKKEYHEFTV